MNAAVNQFSSLVTLQQHRHRKRLYLASLVAVLIAILFYETQWLNLRAGLLVLLIGQAGDVLALFVRNLQLSKDAAHLDAAALPAWFDRWFDHEATFLKRLARFDTACQLIGFLALGFAFWMSTQNLWLALAIGVVYPAAFYFGIGRPRTLTAIRQLRSRS